MTFNQTLNTNESSNQATMALNSISTNSGLSTSYEYSFVTVCPLYIQTNEIIAKLTIYRALLSLLLLPFLSFAVLITFIGFMILIKWKNPVKVYYIIISISNLVALCFQDLITTATESLYYIIFQLQFDNSFYWAQIVVYLELINFNIVFCRVIPFVANISNLVEFWTTAIFALHRMLIVSFPFKTYLIKKIFNKWLLVAILIFVISPFTPQLFLNYLSINLFSIWGNQTFCITTQDKFLDGISSYTGQVANIVEYFLPFILIASSLSIILFYMARAARTREQFSSHASLPRKTAQLRANIVMIVISVIYLISTVPLFIGYIFSYFYYVDEYYDCQNWSINIILGFILGWYSLSYELIRTCDCITFFITISQFRLTVLNIFKCKFSTLAVNQ